MRKISKLVGISLILALAVTGCSYLQPEPEVKVETELEEVKIAVVDKDFIWGQSEFGVEYQQKLEDKADELAAETEADSIQQDSELMRELDSYRQKLRQDFNEQVETAAQTVMDKEGYKVVLDQAEVQYGGIDVTEEILAELEEIK